MNDDLRGRLARRAALLDAARGYLRASGALEVTTPVAVRYASVEPAITNLALAPGQAAGGATVLRTSPESALKQLVAAGSGDVFEIGPVFRAAEHGRRHRVEFTLLEWYRVGRDHHALMDDVEALMRAAGFARPLGRVTYAHVFEAVFGAVPHRLEDTELAALVAALDAPPALPPAPDRALLLDCLYAGAMEAEIARRGAVFVYDYPVAQRAYARLGEGEPAVAERFELVVDGLELANGYHEVHDAQEQRACFEAENAVRRRRGLAPVAPDADWLAALTPAAPPSAGVALGIERLLMVLGGHADMAAVAVDPSCLKQD